MSGPRIPVDFFARFDTALKEFSGFQKNITGKVGDIEDRFSKMGGVLKLAFSAFATSKIVNALKDMIAEAVQSEKALKQLSGALKGAGDFSEQNIKSFQEQATALSKLSKFSDDAIITQFAVAKSFGVTNKEAVKLIKASIDLAAATGTELPTAVELLGKSLDGTAGKLNEMFPELRKFSAEQLAAGAAVDFLGEKFAGFASGEASSFDFAIQKVNKSFNDFEKISGEAITKSNFTIEVLNATGRAFDRLADNVKEGRFFPDQEKQLAAQIRLVKEMNGMIDVTDEMIEANKRLAKEAAAVKSAFDAQAPAVNRVSKALEEQYKTIITESKKIGTDEIDRINKELALKIDTIKKYVALRKSSEGEAAIAISVLQKDADKKVHAEKLKLIQEQENKIKAQAERFGKFFQEPLKIFFDELTTNVDRLAAGFGFLNTILKNSSTGALDAKKNYGEQTQAIQEEYDKQYKNIMDSLKRGTISQDQANEAGLELVRKFDEDSLKAEKDYLKQLEAAREKSREGAAKAIAGVGAGIADSILPGLGQAVGPLLEALSKGPEAVKEMVSSFFDAVPDVIVAIIEAVPVLIETLADKLPDIVEKLLEKLPDIILKLVEKLPALFTKLAVELPARMLSVLAKGIPIFIEKLVAGAGEFLKRIGQAALDFGANIGAGASSFVASILEGAVNFVASIISGASQFITQIVTEITGFLDKINPLGQNGIGGSGGVGGYLGRQVGGDVGQFIDNILPFAEGGIVNPKPGGTIARIGEAGEAEAVIPLSKLHTVLPQAEQKNQGQGPSVLHINLTIGQNQLAKSIIDLKRLGYRLEPA